MLRKASKVLAEDFELDRRIRSGESEAEEELVWRFQPGLMAIARVRVGRDHAADLVQETLTAGLLNLRRGAWKGDGPLAAYLATIMRRTIRGLRSGMPPAVASATTLDRVPAPGIDPLAAVQKAEERDQLRAALGRLRRHHREVLLRYYFDGQSVEEIARSLGIPRGTVLSRLFHARGRISKTVNRWRARRH